MRRAPVLDQRRTTVPARAAVQLLDVGAALPTEGDDVSLVASLGLEAAQVPGVVGPAEGTPDLREPPSSSAEVTGQPPAAVLHHVDEPGRRPAKRADAEAPVVSRREGVTAPQPLLQGRAEGGDGQDAERVGG